MPCTGVTKSLLGRGKLEVAPAEPSGANPHILLQAISDMVHGAALSPKAREIFKVTKSELLQWLLPISTPWLRTLNVCLVTCGNYFERKNAVFSVHDKSLKMIE